VSAAEIQGARLAMEARRADLTIETAKWLKEHAAADTAGTRQAAFMTVAALQGLRRFDDAVKEMKEILERYPPQPPSATAPLDPILALPEAIVTLKRNLGDEEGAARERREAAAYFQGLLERPLGSALEAQVRVRLLRTYLELDQHQRALQEANALERLAIAVPDLQYMLAEVAYAKGKIFASTQRDPSEGISILDRLSTDFPASPLAPRAMYEAAALLESKGVFRSAKDRYEALLQRFPESPEVAPLAMYRLALVQDRLGDWGTSKRTLEAVPIRYPRSQAAVEAPLAVIQHYLREGRRTAARAYMPRALELYQELLVRDSASVMAPMVRAKMYQLYAAQDDSLGLDSITEQMLRLEPRHPFTAQMVLESARAAAARGNKPRAAEYLRQYLKLFPTSPVVDRVRRELREYGG
jgi:outer membrane protein assembly factor BamD (BamD/ComL family)